MGEATELRQDFIGSITYHISKRIAIRAYKNAYPNFLEIASLQKGLILIFNDLLIVEEGIGFGVPVVKYNGSTYFSSSAKCSFEKVNSSCIIMKTFYLDSVARKSIRKTYINQSFYRAIRKTFESLYLSKKRLRNYFNLLMRLRQLIGVRTDFVKVKSKGSVTVKYELHENTIGVSVSLADLEPAANVEVLLLNEQGASFFELYLDTDGLRLLGDEIGAWEKVTAASASLTNRSKTLRFTLTQQGHATLYRGREKIKKRFSWSGLSYLLDQGVSDFKYCIALSDKGELTSTD